MSLEALRERRARAAEEAARRGLTRRRFLAGAGEGGAEQASGQPKSWRGSSEAACRSTSCWRRSRQNFPERLTGAR
jgi:hypothetical protein